MPDESAPAPIQPAASGESLQAVARSASTTWAQLGLVLSIGLGSGGAGTYALAPADGVTMVELKDALAPIREEVRKAREESRLQIQALASDVKAGDTRLEALEEARKDHEQRLRDLERR